MFLNEILRPLAFAVCVAILLAPVIGFSHALIPHTHTHAHNGALHLEIWEGLHGMLSRKDVALPLLFIPFFIFLIVAHGLLSPKETQTFLHPLGTVLRRGILPHRKFG